MAIIVNPGNGSSWGHAVGPEPIVEPFTGGAVLADGSTVTPDTTGANGPGPTSPNGAPSGRHGRPHQRPGQQMQPVVTSTAVTTPATAAPAVATPGYLSQSTIYPPYTNGGVLGVGAVVALIGYFMFGRKR